MEIKTDVLIANRDESPLVGRNIVTSGHVISGQARFGTAQLHYFKLLRTGSSHGKSVQANSLLLILLFLILSRSTRDHE